jgi:serine/threonine-protein kinase
MTQLGMILGTAAYMAPEQASGKSVDKRADIWAFGVVLWEMLTGRRMFEGETISHVLAAVLTREPDLSAVPPRVRTLLSRCLEKDARKRLRDIGDAMSHVPAAGEPGPAVFAAAPARRWLAPAGWTAAALAVALAVLAWTRSPDVAEDVSAVVRFQIERAGDVYNRTTSGFAVSPDGGDRLLQSG